MHDISKFECEEELIGEQKMKDTQSSREVIQYQIFIFNILETEHQKIYV